VERLGADSLAMVSTDTTRKAPAAAGAAPADIDPRLWRALHGRVKLAVDQRRFEPPRLPRVALEVARLAEDERSSAEDMAAIIHRDQFLAGRVLALANSAARGARGCRILNLRQAVARLGINIVRDAIMTAALQQSICKGRRKNLMARLWQASLGSAMGCRLLGSALGKDADKAFLIGLLHDIGKPVVVWLADKAQRPIGIADAELDGALPGLIKEFHCDTGARIARRWRLPPLLTNAIEHHHDRAPPKGYRMVMRTIRVSELMYRGYRDGLLAAGEEDRSWFMEHALVQRYPLERTQLMRAINVYPGALDVMIHA